MAKELTKNEKLIRDLKSITDSSKLKDDILSGEKVQLFRCAGSGLYFPSDYLEMWGRKYGLGLGPVVVSECLETEWQAGVAIPKDIKSPTQIMFPLKQGNHQVDAYIVKSADIVNFQKEYQFAVLIFLDAFMEKRAGIIRDKQLRNKNGRLAATMGVNGMHFSSIDMLANYKI